MTEMSRQIIGHDLPEELQEALNQNRVLRLLMIEEQNEADTVVDEQEHPVAAQEELATMGSTQHPFSNAQPAFIEQAMTTLEAWLAER